MAKTRHRALADLLRSQTQNEAFRVLANPVSIGYSIV
jgi:hypothetical protein